MTIRQKYYLLKGIEALKMAAQVAVGLALLWLFREFMWALDALGAFDQY